MANNRGVLLLAMVLVACSGADDVTPSPFVAASSGVPSGPPPQPESGSSFAADAGAREDDASGAPLPSTPGRRVFVTSETSNGAFGSIAASDAICAAAAQRANLGAGPWVAWLSVPGTNAIDRIVYAGPYDRLDGKRVVADKSALAQGTLSAAIELTETGALASGTKLVWTGTSSGGTAAGATCTSWTTSSVITFGVAGSLDRTENGKWTDNGGAVGLAGWGCQTRARLYCFEQ
jgi:Protein of unknown function (DUF1554)